MIYAHKKKSHTQDVGEHETVKRRLLEKNGWYVFRTPETEPTVINLLPNDFPGVEHLRTAQILTYAELEAYTGDLTEIAGIGKATAEKINAALR